MGLRRNHQILPNEKMVNGASSALLKYWEYMIEHFGIPLNHYCVKLFYTIHAQFTFFNLMIFLIKAVPLVIYIHKFIKNIYLASRERLKLKRVEIEDIELQIQILNSKLKLREAECAERAEVLRRKVEQLRKVRRRVQEIIATDDELRNTISNRPPWENRADCNVNNTPEEGILSENLFFVELLKELKCDQVLITEDELQKSYQDEPGEPASDTSVYSSAHDENKQDYHVKIVKVTNVYKVAYLRHFIKQKKLRRANKQALLRKKIDKIKKLFDDWQQSLQMVINNKLSFVNLDQQKFNIASQEAMGDFSKFNLNSSLDTDSDCRNSADGYQDEYCVSWTQNQYRPMHNGDTNDDVKHEYFDLDVCINKISRQKERCDCLAPEVLFVVPEETSSQIEIEEIKSEN